jgi:hypothetical protein
MTASGYERLLKSASDLVRFEIRDRTLLYFRPEQTLQGFPLPPWHGHRVVTEQRGWLRMP